MTEATEEPDVLSCRSEVGITVGLVDAAIAVIRALAEEHRDLSPQPVQEALKDLFQDPDLRTVRDALVDAEALELPTPVGASAATPNETADSVGTSDTCRIIELADGPIRLHGTGELTEEGVAALESVVAAAKRRMDEEPPNPSDFTCPRCAAVPGQMCRRENGPGGRAPHDERRALAAAAADTKDIDHG